MIDHFIEQVDTILYDSGENEGENDKGREERGGERSRGERGEAGWEESKRSQRADLWATALPRRFRCVTSANFVSSCRDGEPGFRLPTEQPTAARYYCPSAVRYQYFLVKYSVTKYRDARINIQDQDFAFFNTRFHESDSKYSRVHLISVGRYLSGRDN